MNKTVTSTIAPDLAIKEHHMYGVLQQTVITKVHRYGSGKYKGFAKGKTQRIINHVSGKEYVEETKYNKDGTTTREMHWLR